MKAALLALVCCVVAAPVRAQDITLFNQTTDHAKAADILSTAGVVADLGLSTYQAWKSDRPQHALICEGVRVGTSIAISEVLKRVVHERRPDGSDDRSFPSEHTMISAAAPPTFGWGIGFSVGVGIGRVVAQKHHPWDVAVGAGTGLATHWLCR